MSLTGRGVPTAGPALHRVLLVDDDEAVLEMMTQSLECNGFSVVGVGGVTDALKRIATEDFDILITDLHMPNAGDGFTVISAMRHSQPTALTNLFKSRSRREQEGVNEISLHLRSNV